MSVSFDQLDRQIDTALRADRDGLRRQLASIRRASREGRPWQRRLERFERDLERSTALRAARHARLPRTIAFDEALPIVAKRDRIAEAIAANPVVIVCGETGSGKSTQLPKICLGLGRGVEGQIGHTQPRRIAAQSIAARVAAELGVAPGTTVGYKIRFTDQTGPQTLVKLMTDGVLLAELQQDRLLERYDTIIIDEAHERSLNIDFLLGHLKRLLPKRRDLRLIVTSATIDAARFSEFFASPAGPAPVVEVSGRTYPVELRYRPIEPDEESGEADCQRAVADAVEELVAEGPGDVLVFMPTERDIHETAKVLRGRTLALAGGSRKVEILPLYARLPSKEQQRVFEPHSGRRIVIATNVAESSLTVPGIRYVVDPGTARLSRYSPRTKTQRLPIEPVARASADQRAGRCGRTGPGICVRLFGEDDYLGRDRFTPPEIQRANLASVILQTMALRLGPIEDFPLLDPPRRDAIADGYRTLFELGAIDQQRQLTAVGRRLSRLPVDPRIGRMLLAAEEEDCLAEVLVIAAALEVQDPRERPLDQQEAADAAHARFAGDDSDFIGCLKLWDFYQQLKRKLSRNQLRRACRQNFLSFNRMREWADICLQLRELLAEAGITPRPRRDDYGAIHRAVLAGLLANVAFRRETYEYSVAGGGKAHLWPGSTTFAARPKWTVAAEVVETTKRYLRCCARIDPRWIEPLAGHLVKRTYSEPFWDRQAGSAMATEKVSLFGLPVVPARLVRYGPIDPVLSREMLIRHGLVEGQLDTPAHFLEHNLRLQEEMERLEQKLRRHDVLLAEPRRQAFYERRLPAEVCDGATLLRWWRKAAQTEPRILHMEPADLVADVTAVEAGAGYPDSIQAGAARLPLRYRFEPGEDDDGVTVAVPVEAVNQLDAERLQWSVPGLLEGKVTALVRSLPKSLRRLLVPAAESARAACRAIRFGEGRLLEAVAAALSSIAGQRITADDFRLERVPPEYQLNVRVVDPNGLTLAQGRDLGAIRRELGEKQQALLETIADSRWCREGLTDWDFDELPVAVEISRGGLPVRAYPGLVDDGRSVALRLFDSVEKAAEQTRHGLRRLFCLRVNRELRSQVAWFPGLDQLRLWAATLRGFDLQQQLGELIADRALFNEPSVPRNRREFDKKLLAAEECLGVAVQEVAGVVPALLGAYHEARLAVDALRSPAWQDVVDDVESQLANLTGPDFLVAVPWRWLQQYPRYFRAVVHRLDRCRGGNRDRDRWHMAELAARWDAYREQARLHQATGVYDPELIHYRWMLEEYRVSLFAEKLGTALSVSAKRLDRQWARVRT